MVAEPGGAAKAASRTNQRRFQPKGDAALALADGRIFRGRSFGAHASVAGEVVFTTTMVGYQEVCTDPSFRGQIVCMTYPLIGNYGIFEDANESRQPWISGLIVRELCREPNHFGSLGNLGDFLKRHNIPGISQVDTRALTRHIRSVGDIRAVLVPDAVGMADEDLVRLATEAPLPGERDVVAEVVVTDRMVVNPAGAPHVVIIDCGVKHNIVESLRKRGTKITIVPFGATLEYITALRPDGVIVSPGPGDPAMLDAGQELVRVIAGSGLPYFGICLGHQLLARAIGGTTTKLRFGHRGGNQPVRDTRSGKVTITTQNHGFQVDGGSIPERDGWEIALVNLNDGSVEGLAHKTLPVLSVQFHPESSPGPLDNDSLFDRFVIQARQYASARGATENAR